MDMEMDKGKKNSNSSILRKLEGFLSMKKGSRTIVLSKSKSWHSGSKAKSSVVLAPQGCFCVYVGPEKEKFIIKAKYANHPLFKMLLEDAEMEYGYSSQGPILLPCDVNLFHKVLCQMDSEKEINGPGCGLASCSPFSPARVLGHGEMGKGYGSYGILTTPRMLKLNSSN
ncbi:auxin-responsive protein SAUR71-like [Solanum dulcamara]|uniref:auxin-responsive protein SAUR71-like n=1 Tax=Solanum dulcamara TaxID=45834 RepID=UPI0024853DD7|nr:auxin-responsive protein SAUR71-like [Solanum dulcamara]